MHTKKSMFIALYAVLKKELKAKGLGYRNVAEALGVSTGSVKHRFADRTLTMEQIIAISDLLGIALSDLMRSAETPMINKLTMEQEIAFVANMPMSLVLLRVTEGWSLAEIVATYEITEAECIKHLLELDRLGLIDLLPGNIIRPRAPRNAEWQPGGPLRRFLASSMNNFFDTRFDGPFENCILLRGDITAAAFALFQDDLRELQQRMEVLHEESKIAPPEQRHHVAGIIATREWELPEFSALRRKRGKPKK